MRTRHVARWSLAAALVAVFAMVVPSARAAQVAGSTQAAATAGMAGPQRAGERPQLTTNTKAPCNTKPTKGYAQCFAVVRTPADHQITPFADQPPPTALGPADIKDAYNLPDSGDGQTVAIVDAGDDADAESDLAVFRQQYGLPPCTSDNGCFRKFNQRGEQGNYPPDAGWGIEISLDLDAVSAACPACHILLVEADSALLDDMGAAVEEAVALGAKYVSNSYGLGGNEIPGETDYDHYFDHKGVAITFSSGDSPHPNYPASNPHVTAAGGTRLTRDASTDRGWTEVPWTSGGSGCSAYEPKPDYQYNVDTNCDMRATADVSADADPQSGLAVYDSHDGYDWVQVGGTSLSSPLTASMYALAGPPVEGTYPVTYPYYPANRGGFFDITEGENGDCDNLPCQAGPGWDDPTGWGTPNGVAAFRLGPHGDIAGTVTDKAQGDPIGGATVSSGDYSVRTDAKGHYDLPIAVGSYDVTGSMFGYASATRTDVQVSEDKTTTVDFRLTALPSATVSGTVTDGSGHGWSLYARITVDGYPNGAIYTNPYTGHYSVDLPQRATYALHVAPVSLPSYVTKDLQVDVGTSDKQQDIAVSVDQSACMTPGYTSAYTGAREEFTGWTGNTAQDGWTVINNLDNGNYQSSTWHFNHPSGYLPPPGGDADFAIASAHYYGDPPRDTSLVSPIVDLSDETAPEIGFDTYYRHAETDTADVDLSLDGGQTWTTVWHHTTESVQDHVDIPIPQAAGQNTVQVRFHYYTGSNDAVRWYWELDDVVIGAHSCDPTPGGLVAGAVTDDNTGDPVNGATVASSDAPSAVGLSAATPDDPNLADGFYWLFSSSTGDRAFTATDDTHDYAPTSATVDVAADEVTRQDWAMPAGHLTVTPERVSVTQRLGRSTSRKVTFTNDGTVPMHLRLGEQNGGFTPTGRQTTARAKGAPPQRIKVPVTLAAKRPRTTIGATPTARPRPLAPTPQVPPWTDIADYPTTIMDNAVASHDGKVYSVAGYDGSAVLKSSYVYDPARLGWTPIANAPTALEAPAAAFVDDTMYLAGGWDGSRVADSVYAYHPDSDRWTQVADLPAGVFSAATAVLDGQLYVVGGCTSFSCRPVSATVYRYDPDADQWSRLADYPTPMAYGACAGVTVEIVCAGGNTGTVSLASTRIYDPDTDSWTSGADMPYDNWGMVSSGSNNRLQVVAGVTGGAITNRAGEYDPVTDSWSALPNANNVEYRGGGSCGLYQIGGLAGPWAERSAAVLPGYQCDTAHVPWLTEDTTDLQLDAGRSATVTVRLDASAVSQPGGYSAALWISTDTPYPTQLVTVAMRVAPPRTWGRVAGTVSDAETGTPVTGATVAICANYRQGSARCGPMTYPVKTDQSGHYQLWLGRHDNPLQVSAAKDGYQPQATIARIRAGKTTTVTFALKRS